MEIRESLENDKNSIRKLDQDAFGQPEGDAVSQLAIDLLEDKTALPILSLVAEQDNEIIGNVIFSPISIEGAEWVSAYILAPLAVAGLSITSAVSLIWPSVTVMYRGRFTSPAHAPGASKQVRFFQEAAASSPVAIQTYRKYGLV